MYPMGKAETNRLNVDVAFNSDHIDRTTVDRPRLGGTTVHYPEILLGRTRHSARDRRSPPPAKGRRVAIKTETDPVRRVPP